MNVTTYGLDIAKSVFQLCWVEPTSGEVRTRKLGRPQLVEFLAKRPQGPIALEACASSHCWGRKLTAMGHEAILLHPKFIRPFVQTNKTDAADAKAIWTALQQPGMRTVIVRGLPANCMHFSRTKTAFLSITSIKLLDAARTGWGSPVNWPPEVGPINFVPLIRTDFDSGQKSMLEAIADRDNLAYLALRTTHSADRAHR